MTLSPQAANRRSRKAHAFQAVRREPNGRETVIATYAVALHSGSAAAYDIAEKHCTKYRRIHGAQAFVREINAPDPEQESSMTRKPNAETIRALVSVWTVTTDGDNQGIETRVFPTEHYARQQIIEAMAADHKWDKARLAVARDASTDQLTDLWTQLYDGACIIERHTVNAPLESSR